MVESTLAFFDLQFSWSRTSDAGRGINPVNRLLDIVESRQLCARNVGASRGVVLISTLFHLLPNDTCETTMATYCLTTRVKQLRLLG